jgi:hypothetical protein
VSDTSHAASTRFPKGQSGNPRGRPRKQTVVQASAFDIVIDRTLTIIQDGKPREVTVEEALQHKTYQDAIAGNRAARREVLKMIAKREQALAAKASAVPVKLFQFCRESPDPSNADEAMLILGICRRDPRGAETAVGRERLLLEPWAVEAALGRRAARKLNQRDIDDAKRCTDDADSVRWPVAVEP